MAREPQGGACCPVQSQFSKGSGAWMLQKHKTICKLQACWSGEDHTSPTTTRPILAAMVHLSSSHTCSHTLPSSNIEGRQRSCPTASTHWPQVSKRTSIEAYAKTG